MRKLTTILWLMTHSICIYAQNKDSTSQNLEKVVDSAFKELYITKSFKDLPRDGYYIVKIKFTNGSELRAPFYKVADTKLYTYSKGDAEKLDTVDAITVKHISFRKYQRTASLAVIGAGTGALAGGATAAALYDCSNCDGDDFHIEQVWWGLGGAVGGAVVGAIGGLAVAAFNNGSFNIKGDPEKLKRLNPRINRFAVK